MNCELQARTMTASHQQLLCSLSALAIFQFPIRQSPHFHLWKPQSLIIRKSNDSKLRKGSLRIVSGDSSTQPRLRSESA